MEYYEDLNDKIERLEIDFITNDFEAWEKNKENKKIYNKLWLVEKQNVPCGPIGTDPLNYPIIIKPIINLYGMSRGFKKINNKEEYYENQKDGHFWMPYLDGKHYTVDIILYNGKVIDSFFMESKPLTQGTFDYHVYLPELKLSEKITIFLEENFPTYSGAMNIEIINNIIIEGHLRLNGDCYIYKDKFFKNLNKLILNKKFKLKVNKKKFYLFPYFVPSNFNINILNKDEIEELLLENKIKNIRWDNINSQYQRQDFSRLLMFKTKSLSKGLQVKKLIDKSLNLRKKIYQIEIKICNS